MAKKKKVSRSPFVGHSIEEIAYAEATSYVIQVGVDFLENKGHLTFSRKGAESLYIKVLGSLLHSIENGDEKEKSTALKCLNTLQLLPLRIQ